MAEPTEEIQELLNFLLPVRGADARAQHGEFYPYAAALGCRRRAETRVGTDLDDDSPDVGEVLLALHEGCASGPPRARCARPASRRT